VCRPSFRHTAWPDTGPGGVNPRARQKRVDLADVGGWIADFGPASGSTNHHAANPIRPAEHGRGLVQPSAITRERICELDTIWPAISTGSVTSNFTPDAAQNRRKTSTLPERLQPKKKFGPSTIARAASRSRTMRSKNSRTSFRGIVYRWDKRTPHQRPFPARISSFRSGHSNNSGAASGRRTRVGDGSNVKHHGRPAHEFRHLAQPLDQPRMSQMNAVEIADRNRAAVQRFRNIVKIAKKNHAGKISDIDIES